MLRAIDANSTSNTQRVSGELGFSQSNVVRHSKDFNESIQGIWFVTHALKYCKTFESLLHYTHILKTTLLFIYFALSAGAVEYTDFLSAEE